MPRSIKAMEGKVRIWNKCYPVGTEVTVLKDAGQVVTTVTTSEAYMLGASHAYPGHTPVIKVRGIPGCYLLDRVRPLK